MVNRSYKLGFGISVCLLSIVVGFSCFLWFSRLPVREGKLQSIPIGAPQAEVLKLVGKPTQVWSDNRTWAYWKTNGSITVYLKFDSNMLFMGFELDN